MSLDLLSVLADRDNYDRYGRFVKPETLSDEVKIIVRDLKKYYAQFPSVSEIDWVSFDEWFRIVQHSGLKEDKYRQFAHIFSTMEHHTPSDLAESIIEKYVAQDYFQQVADIALRGAEGESVDFADIEALLADYSKEVDRVSRLDTFFVSDDIDELLHDVVDGGYSWRMKFLNRATGNLRPGKLVCIAMRPNTGKTTLLASEATYMASQMEEDECILWFNNEEAGADVKLRIVQAALQQTVEQLRKNPAATKAAYEKAVRGTMGKIKVVDKADISVKDAEEFIKAHKVKAVIFDQLWKVHGFEKSSATDTARLGNVFQWAREIGKKYGVPVITSHQVKTEGEGVEYLTPSMLYLSGTAIQGEVDTLILMGRNFHPGQETTRFVVIGKNKGAYGPVVDPSLSEGRAIVTIKPETASWEEP